MNILYMWFGGVALSALVFASCNAVAEPRWREKQASNTKPSLPPKHTPTMPETRRLTEADIIQADMERAAQAGWLALCSLPPQPKDTATYAGVMRWTRAVNKRAAEIFARLQ